MENKNKIWFEKFESGNFDRILYVEGNHVYYDLIVLETINRSTEPVEFHAIPVPIFAKQKMGMEINGQEISPGILERLDIISSFRSDHIIRIITRDEYNEILEEEKKRMEGLKFYNSLSEDEKKMLEHVDLILERTENQFGEMVATDYIEGTIESGFVRRWLTCWSSEDYGFGTCQCVSHRAFSEQPISAESVLNLIKEKRGA